MMTQPSSEKSLFQTLVERWLNALARLPRWLAPAALWASIGAALLFCMTLVRGVFLLFAAPRQPTALLAFLGALVVATVAGGLAGAAFVVIRVPLRRLSVVGDLLTGPILGCAYVFVILVPAKYLFHDDSLQTREDWLTAAAFGAGFGLLGTVVYWYQSWRFKRGR